MNCPYCGSVCADDARFCPNCKQPLHTEAEAPEGGQERKKRTPAQRVIFALLTLAFVAGMSVGVVKLTGWVKNYQLIRLYTRGAYAPTLSLVQMDDLRQGHAIVFYGKDGDQIYVPELGRSLAISGGVARMEIADSDWFGANISDVEYADVTLTPTLITEKGTKTALPQYNFKIEVPTSPLVVKSPAQERTTVVTGIYPLELNVVPGSTVFVNGEDVTPSVDRSGLLSTYVSVKPIGDNIITLIVRTPRHRERRSEVTLFRQHYDIELELDTTVSDVSSARTMAVTGTTEPGADIAVETDHIPESVSIDAQTGRFSFIAKFGSYGINVIRFRTIKDGKEASISFNVNYRPSLAEMSGRAWAMDYPQLRVMFENWRYQSFACRGRIIDSFVDDETGESYLVMDVGKDERQLVILDNQSTVTSPTLGRRYLAYAYVDGQYMYQAQYYPRLIALYMDVAADN